MYAFIYRKLDHNKQKNELDYRPVTNQLETSNQSQILFWPLQVVIVVATLTEEAYIINM